MVQERPDLKPYEGQKLTVIAWLWARTVKSPNPAFAQVDVPLASTFMLSTKAGKEAYVEPVIEGGGYRFTVKVGKPKDAEAAKNGTKSGRERTSLPDVGNADAGDYIKDEAKAGRMGARLMAIVAEGVRERIYLAPTPEMEKVALSAQPDDRKNGKDLPKKALGFRIQEYGMHPVVRPLHISPAGGANDLLRPGSGSAKRVKSDALAAGLADTANLSPQAVPAPLPTPMR